MPDKSTGEERRLVVNMDGERFYKRLENLETSSNSTAIQLARLSSLIESETGNVTKHIDAIYKIVDRHDKMIFGDGQPGLLTKVEEIKDLRRDQENHATQDRWLFGSVITLLLFIIGKLFFK